MCPLEEGRDDGVRSQAPASIAAPLLPSFRFLKQMRRSGNDNQFFLRTRKLCHSTRFISIMGSSFSPTIKSVDACTDSSAFSAGRPPRDTTAEMTPGSSAAAASAPPAPVLAPKYPNFQLFCFGAVHHGTESRRPDASQGRECRNGARPCSDQLIFPSRVKRSK